MLRPSQREEGIRCIDSEPRKRRLSSMIQTLGQVSSPEQILQRELERFTASASREKEIAFRFDVERYWIDQPDSVNLLAACQLSKQSDQIHIAVTLTVDSEAINVDIAQSNPTFRQLCERHTLPEIDLARPLRLGTVNIPKPWGQEIWYTGIERRGVSTVEGIPLPWLLELYPAICAGRQRDLILLKILDPLPVAVQGDLYFEMHREKTEVYIVTHVDEGSWPGGIGKIRYGFDTAKISQFQSDDEFRSAYLAAVQSYRSIRQRIDTELDGFRQQEGYGLSQPIQADLLSRWLARLQPEWIEQEQKLRTEMEAFTHMRDVKVGDVLRVQPFTPHALQHGVRTIEFQTPHYERQIISFAQKVLTQDHWDSIEAIEAMTIRAPLEADLPMISNDAGVKVEGVADFAQFRVHRLSLQPGASYRFDGTSYGLTIGVTGVCLVNGEHLIGEQAVLIPAHLPAATIENSSADKATCLLAAPAG